MNQLKSGCINKTNLTLTFQTLSRPVIRYALENGVTADQLAEIIGIDTSALTAPDMDLTAARFIKVIRKLMAVTHDSHLGLHIGQTIRCHDLGVLGYVLLNCRSFGESLDKHYTYYELADRATRLIIDIDQQQVHYNWLIVNEDLLEIRQFLLDTVVASVVPIFRELVGEDVVMSEVRLGRPEPENVGEYAQYFGVVPKFNQPETTLSYAKTYLTIPIKTHNSELLPVFESYTREYYEQISKNTVYSRRVMRLLLNKRGNIDSLDSIATTLDISVRNLQLKLKREDTSFSELRNQVRCDIAKNYLQNNHYPIKEICTLLNFSEPSVFYRTFKRWTGLTPNEYRTRYGTIA